MSESERPRLDPTAELLVRDLVESQLARRLDGYKTIIRYSALAATTILAVLGLKTCSSIEHGAMETYEQHIKRRLDSTDGSSEVARYQARLKALFDRAVIDSAVVRAERIQSQVARGQFRLPRLPAEDIRALTDLALSSSTAEREFADALDVLGACAQMSTTGECQQVGVALTDALAASPKASGLRADRRAAVITCLARLRHRDAVKVIRPLLSETVVDEDLRGAAIGYVGRIRDVDAVDHLAKLVLSDNGSLSDKARETLAIIQPDHMAIANWISGLSKSPPREIAEALRVSLEVANAADEAVGFTAWIAMSSTEKQTRWTEAARRLFDSVIVSARDNGFSLHGDISGQEDRESALPGSRAKVYLRRDADGTVWSLSLSLLNGAMSTSRISKLLDFTMRGSPNDAARLLRFLGAVAEPGSLTKVVLSTRDGGAIKVRGGKIIDRSITDEITLRASPKRENNSVFAYWIDLGGHVQTSDFEEIMGKTSPYFRLGRD